MRKKVKGYLALLLCLPLALGIVMTSVQLKARAAESYTVTTAERKQTVDGWGTSLIWWAGMVGGYDQLNIDGVEVRDEIMRLIYSADGLDYNIARYNVPGGDHTSMYTDEFGDDAHVSHMQQGREMEGFQKSEGGEYDWNADKNQRWILQWIMDNVDEPIVEYFSNSPPWWMTVTGCASGNGGTSNLKSGYEDEFAKYFVDVLYHLVTVDGMKFQYVNPFNESTSDWWGNLGSQEGCKFTDQERADILYYMVEEMEKYPELDDVMISFDDSTEPYKAYKAYKALLDIAAKGNGKYDKVLARLGKLNYHLYDDNAGLHNQSLLSASAATAGIGNWMSEMGYSMDDGLDDVPMDTAFEHSYHIRESFAAGAEAYVLWQIIEELSSQFGREQNYGPIKVSYNDSTTIGNYGYRIGSYTLNKQYYVLGQYSKYIKAGYSIVPTSDGKAVAAVSPEGDKVVIVHENNSADTQEISYTLDGSVITEGRKIVTDKTSDWKISPLAAAGTSFSATVTPYSVTTFELDTVPTKASYRFIDEGKRVNAGSGYNDTFDMASIKTTAATLDALPDAEKMQYERFYLTSGWNGADSSGSGARWAGTGNAVKFKFNGTGVALRFKYKGASANDAATVKVKLYDGEGTLIDERLDLVAQDARADSGAYFGNLYTRKGLSAGDYVVTIELVGGYADIDGAYVYSGVDDERTLPELTAASIIGGNLYVRYDGGAARVLYREWGGRWMTAEAVTDGPVVGGLTADRYEVKLQRGENVSQAKEVVPVERGENVVYYVDAGAVDTGAYTVYERAGSLNTFKDQPFGVDPITGKSWGMTSTGNDKFSMGTIGSPYRALGDCVSADSSYTAVDTDDAIEYAFEVEAEKSYDIVLGMNNTWGGRKADITLNGGTAKTDFLATGNTENFIILRNVAAVEVDGKQLITIKITRSADEPVGNNPLLGTVTIAESEHKAAFVGMAAQMTEVEGTPDGTVHLRKAKRTTPYMEDITLDGAYVYYTDGTFEKKDATFDELRFPVVAPNTVTPNSETEISGTVDGWYFIGKLVLAADVQTYYFIDCGTDGTNAAPAGTLQDGVFDRKAPDDSGWGYIGKNTAGWENEGYDSSMRRDAVDGFVYRLTNLPTDRDLVIEVGGWIPSDWGSRKYSVHLTDVNNSSAANDGNCIGTFDLVKQDENAPAGSKTKDVITKTMRAPASTSYVYFKKISGDGPNVSYIKVMMPTDTVNPTAPIAPTEAGYTDTVKVSGLTVDDMLILTDENSRYIGAIEVTAETMDVDLTQFPALAESAAVQFSARRAGALADSPSAFMALPGVNITGFHETWADRDVLHFTPTVGVNINRLVITDPAGESVDVTEREYYAYAATLPGTYKAEITTRVATYVRTFDVYDIDTVLIDAAYSQDYTKGNVTVTVTVQASVHRDLGHALKEFRINGVPVELDANGRYTFTATENGTFELTAINMRGEVFTDTVVIAYIDRAGAQYRFRPDFTYLDGFKAELANANVSGGVYTVTKDEKTVTSVGAFRAVEAGLYNIRYENGVGDTAEFTFRLSYRTEDTSAMQASLDDNVLTVKEGVKVYRMGSGKEIQKTDGAFRLVRGHRYIAYSETETGYEALILTVDAQPVETPVAPQSSGCGSALGTSGWALAVLLLVAACVACAAKKGGKRA